MRTLLYFIIGIVFGITMFKSEAASWFRIYEMFQFKSFHMYGIIGSALVFGVLITQAIKKFKIKSFHGDTIEIADKEKGIKRYLYGGIVFGLGWALAGACPGPIFTLIGAGYAPILVVLVSATLGTFVYGRIKDKLPH
ncbi:MAG: YeeE/YedE family protein [Flavobacteriaceae bacterium]|nr:YeeE/YedE family protein [Flavobacteriaceae bacterium]